MKFVGDVDTPSDPVFVTPYFVVHFLWSFIFYLVLSKVLQPQYSFILLMILHGAYEVKDVVFTKDNSIPNSVGDTLASVLGWYAGYYIGKDVRRVDIMSFILLAITIQLTVKEKAR